MNEEIEKSKCCRERAAWNFCFKYCYKCGRKFEPEYTKEEDCTKDFGAEIKKIKI